MLEKLKKLASAQKDNLFDKAAYESILTLLYNSKIFLKLAIEKKNGYSNIIGELLTQTSSLINLPKSQFLADVYEEIKRLNDFNSITDYYGYRILYSFITDFVRDLQIMPEQLIKYNPDKYDDIKITEAKEKAFKIVSYLQTLSRQVLVDLKSSLKRMMTHEVKPAYLTFKECMIPHKWQDGKAGHLFIDSSYVPPNNFGKIKTDIASWDISMNSQFDNLRNSIEMKASHFITDYKNTTFEKKVKDNEFKLVQIIAMFVSIATFVLINVKIFDNKTGIESFAIILGLAACFILFNLFFYFIIMAQIQQSRRLINRALKLSLFFLLPLALCIGSFVLLRKEGEKTTKEIKEIHEKMRTDSIETRLRIDLKR
jgi:hypothetical protein